MRCSFGHVRLAVVGFLLDDGHPRDAVQLLHVCHGQFELLRELLMGPRPVPDADNGGVDERGARGKMRSACARGDDGGRVYTECTRPHAPQVDEEFQHVGLA